MSLTGRSSNTVCDWMNLCRDIPLKMFEKRNKFGGPHVIIQVEKRDKQTLHDIIKREVVLGSIIHSDGWPAYNGIAQYGFTHNTVNHIENFVDPLTQAHTQRIESLWRPLRLKVVKNMCGTSPDLLPR